MVHHRKAYATAVTAPVPSLQGEAGQRGTLPCGTGSFAAQSAIQMEHVSVTTIGRGSPVVLIPGLATPRAVWSGTAPALARNYRLYLVQLNGFGEDDPRANLGTGILSGAVADMHALIEKERIFGASVVGHSLGGLLGLMLARQHAADVGRLMVVDALPFIGTLFSPEATVGAIEPQAAAMRDRMAYGYGRPSNPAVAKATANRLASKPDAQALVADWIAEADARVSGKALYEDMMTDLRPAISEIAAPITVVYPASPRAERMYLDEYRSASRVRFISVEDSAHFVMLDQPSAFTSALQAFLNS